MGGVAIALSIFAVLVLVGIVVGAYLSGGLGALGRSRRPGLDPADDHEGGADDQGGEERPEHRVPNRERMESEGIALPREHERHPS